MQEFTFKGTETDWDEHSTSRISGEVVVESDQVVPLLENLSRQRSLLFEALVRLRRAGNLTQGQLTSFTDYVIFYIYHNQGDWHTGKIPALIEMGIDPDTLFFEEEIECEQLARVMSHE